jgi:hypothetical protein
MIEGSQELSWWVLGIHQSGQLGEEARWSFRAES